MGTIVLVYDCIICDYKITLILIPKSLRLHAPITVVPTSHLYLHSSGQRKSIAGLTPHPSASGSCQYFTHPQHPPLPPSTSSSSPYLLASKVAVLTGDRDRIPTTSSLRLHALQDGADSTVLSSTIPNITAAPTYVYSHIIEFLSPRYAL